MLFSLCFHCLLLVLAVSFFHPLGRLFQAEDVRPVFLTDLRGLVFPELEYEEQKLSENKLSRESQTLQSGLIADESPQPPADRAVAENTPAQGQSGEFLVSPDPQILDRFSLDRRRTEDFSLVFDPASLDKLEKNPQEELKRPRLKGLLSPYGNLPSLGRPGGTGSSLSGRNSPAASGIPAVPFRLEDLSSWADGVLDKIEKNWNPDPLLSQSIEANIIVSVTLTKFGDITDVEVLESSGELSLDATALNAVRQSLPLPSLPLFYPEKTITILIEFEFHV